MVLGNLDVYMQRNKIIYLYLCLQKAIEMYQRPQFIVWRVETSSKQTNINIASIPVGYKYTKRLSEYQAVCSRIKVNYWQVGPQKT